MEDVAAGWSRAEPGIAMLRLATITLLFALLSNPAHASQPATDWQEAATLPDLGSMTQAAPAALLGQKLSGEWRGVLHYRDFGTDKAVRLPTVLVIDGASAALQLVFTYDDGPAKTVRSAEQWSLGSEGALFCMGKDAGPMAVSLLRSNEAGDLALVALGTGTENGAQVEVRSVVLRRGNTLDISRSTRLPKAEWLLRHVYRLSLQQ